VIVVVEFAPEALEEIEEIARRLSESSPSQARRFTAAVALLIKSLESFPHAGPRVPSHPTLRRRTIRSFPHLVMYVVRSDRVYVTQVFHPRRDPAELRKW